MSRYGDEGVQVMEWAYEALTTLASLADAIDVALADLPGRVWPEVAPEPDQQPAGQPWVVYALGTPPADRRAIGGQPRLSSVVGLDVRVTARTRDYSLLAPAARAIYALHGARNIALANGGHIITVQRTGAIQFPETDSGIEYRHLGHQFQVETE